MSTKYSRIMLKLSGEMLGGHSGTCIEKDAIEFLAGEISHVHDKGYEIAVVIGGGNLFRGSFAESFEMERASADYMGMLATCMNALALQAVLEKRFSKYCRVMTAIHMPELAEPYIRRKALKHLREKRIVIFGGGTGNPLFTTDTAASLRALEVGSQIILKATKVDGIYDMDPLKSKEAKRYTNLTYIDVLSQKLGVMDATAITMCMEANLQIKVFKLTGPGCVVEAIENDKIGTIVCN